MGARSKARKRALDILFEADQRGTGLLATLTERRSLEDPPVPDYAVQLVEGVAAHRDRLDALISEHATGWTLDRMPAVDRALLRLALYEGLFCPDIPAAVAIDEAVELAKDLSTDDSPRFVNGLLAAALRVPVAADAPTEQPAPTWGIPGHN